MENMEYILKHFNFKHKGTANTESIIQGNKYRFTVLTDRFIRMEYSNEGIFEDRPSQTFFNRFNEKYDFNVTKMSDNIIVIDTEFLHLEYKIDKLFSEENLSIKLKGKNSIWKYGNKENGNRLGTSRTLDGVNGALVLEDGLFSEDGYVVIDDFKRLVFEDGWIAKRVEGNIDLYYFAYGDDYESGLRDFYKISGKTPLIPRYVLGNWWSRYWEYSDDELKELINNFDKRDIPLSVCIIDMDWHKVDIPEKYGSGWTGYTWNKELFKDPKGMIEWLKNKNLATSLNLHPADGIRGHEEVYKEFAKFMNLDYENEEPIQFDCTDPKFMKAYFEMIHNPLEDIGVDFWWIDWQQGQDSLNTKLDPLWMLNHLHYLDLQRDGNKRGFTFSRYAGIGSHRYPIGFSGDTVVTWESLSFQPYFTSNASNVGYGWWSHDIGGHFYGYEDPELYTRWVQFGVFSPIMRLHTSRNFYHKREPWKWPIENELAVTKYMRLRHQLIPYIYSMAYENNNFGLPLIRPMSFTDQTLSNFKNQYLYGSELLVAPPITKMDYELNKTITNVFLPNGQWFDFFTGEYYKGNKEYTMYSGIDQIPVFAKAGAIIPLSELTSKNQISNPEIIELVLFPGADGEFILYEDDGVSSKYLDGEFVITKIETKYSNNKIELEIHPSIGMKSLIPKNRIYKVIVRGKKINNEIIINGNNGTKIIIDAPINKEYIYEYEIMNILLDAKIETEYKAWIGFIGNNMNTEKGGVLGLDISNKEKIKKVNDLKIDKKLKKMVTDYITKH
ncbi:MAG: Alpha-xylosidase [Candidatus Izimaplasma bacterium HR2]|nr:MAG: Alpha-xylosidase [Candidatus Izimaplasma bacterium HR2]